MLDFIKNVLASIVGIFLAGFILFFFVFIIFVSTSKDPEPFYRDNSVLSVKFTGTIAERASNDPFADLFSMPDPATATLENFEANLRKAAVDNKIQGVLMEIDFLATPWPILQQLRRSIINFREETGKFVYATTNDIGMNEQGFYLASAADSIFAPQHTMMMFDGFAIEGTFVKGLLDKIGVKADVIHRGKYKSAGDGFTRTGFSDADREQLTAIFNDIVDEFESAVSEKTGMTMAEVRDFINAPPRIDIEYYHEHGLIDALVQRDELEKRIKARIGQDDDRKLSLVPNRRYARVSERTAGLGRPARESIAVIYADGPIMPATAGGFGFGESTINADNFGEALEEAMKDNNVKAIVVRINSPGGAGSTSDVIWNMIREAAKEKPIIASMGGVAASGGYYIAMAANEIVAERTTITGSIGVIGMRYDASELLKDKMGLSFDEIRFHKNANWLNPTSPLTAEQRGAFEYFVESFYESFVNRVAESRNRTFDEIHAVAQGRVWSGEDALEIGLVDHVGGLDTAIERAAYLVNLENYSIRTLPREKTIFETIAASSQVSMEQRFASRIPYYNELRFVESMVNVQRPNAWAIMPYFIEIK